MDKIFYSSEEAMIADLVYLLDNTLKEYFFHLRGNLGYLANQRRSESAT